MNRNDLLIEADELASIIDSPDLRLFDATVLLAPGTEETGRTRYDQGHLPGAAFLDHAAVSDASASYMYMLSGETELAAAIGNLGISNDSTVVVYSSESVMWATRIWWVLRYAGHRNVRVLNGGRNAWQGDLETEERIYAPGSFTPDLTPSMIADKDEVLSAIGEASVCTLNALPASFYSGEADVPYAKEGHITGSLSQPFETMMDGRFIKSNVDLQNAFADYDDGRIIIYCGGGIAATLNACCALLAGREDVGVYDGSMSEWLGEELPSTTGTEPGTL